MLQGFYWDSFNDSQWSVLESQADQFKGTFDLVWLPQSGNCGGLSMGYDDLYWFTNYSSSFGNEQQLRSLINTFRDNGIKTIADVVINHRRNVSNWVDFPCETYKGTTYEMKAADIVANDDNGKTKTWATQNGYQLSANNDTGEGWDGMRDLDHKSENVQTIVKAYLDFLKNDLGYAGFRYDMVKGYSPEYTALYNTSAQPEFSVGECWDGTPTIRRWIDGTKADGQPQSAAFDFQFRYTVRNAMNNGNYSRLAQQNDGNWPLVSNNYENGNYRRYAVTFVENHDTERRSNAAQDPLRRDTLAANAYLLAMPGTPCVFMKHWMAYPTQIKAMVAARKQAGVNNESGYQNLRSTSNYYANIIKTGNLNQLLVVVGDVSANEPNVNTSEWQKVLSGHHYAYYLPTTMDISYPDLPSGTYLGEQAVTVHPVSSKSNHIVYTLDGSTPTANSPGVNGAITFTLEEGKTITLKTALIVGGQTVGLAERTYTIKKQSSDAEVPEFCTFSEGEICAFFEAPSTWGDIKCWRWDKQYNYTGNRWPGVDCTFIGTAANGNKVWKWSWNNNKINQSSPNEGIIFNDGANQTADLPFVNTGYYNKDGLKANISTNISTGKFNRTSSTVPVYDLQGRKTVRPRRGLYIWNGRKYLMR